jgi:hypothetical protein
MDQFKKLKNSVRMQINEAELNEEEKSKLYLTINEISGKAALAALGVAATTLAINRNVSDMSRRKKRKELYAAAIKKLEQRKKHCKQNRKCIERIEDKIIEYRISMQK